jgi:hypothetical protein
MQTTWILIGIVAAFPLVALGVMVTATRVTCTSPALVPTDRWAGSSPDRWASGRTAGLPRAGPLTWRALGTTG